MLVLKNLVLVLCMYSITFSLKTDIDKIENILKFDLIDEN